MVIALWSGGIACHSAVLAIGYGGTAALVPPYGVGKFCLYGGVWLLRLWGGIACHSAVLAIGYGGTAALVPPYGVGEFCLYGGVRLLRFGVGELLFILRCRPLCRVEQA